MRADEILQKTNSSDQRQRDQAVYEAAALLNSRMHGRCRGEAVTVEWDVDRQGDYDIALAGAWLMRHNDNNHGIRIITKGEFPTLTTPDTLQWSVVSYKDFDNYCWKNKIGYASNPHLGW